MPTADPSARKPCDLRVLVRPGLRRLDASLQRADAEGLSLVLDAPLEAGAVIAVLSDATSLTDSRILSARVAWCVPRGQAWLASCCFTSSVSERELRQLLG
jgi:hypothetical protein